MVRLTPNGLSVRSRQRAISLVRSSGVGWVSAVMKPERAGVGDGGDQFGASHPLHAALDDRVLDADEFGEPRLDHVLPSVSPARPTARVSWISGQDAVTPRKSPRGRATVRASHSCKSEGFSARRTIPAHPWRDAAYWRNSLVSSPMPPIATVTVLTGSFMTPTPTDVPQAIRSPGNSVMSCEILLTSCCALKIMSDIG